MVKVIHEKCDPKLAEDRKLPYTAYLIEYVDKENGDCLLYTSPSPRD